MLACYVNIYVFYFIHSFEHDMNNNHVKINKFKYDKISNLIIRHGTYNLFINLII